MTKRLHIIACILLVLLMLGACGLGQEPAAEPAVTDAAVTEPAHAPEAGPAEAVETPEAVPADEPEGPDYGEAYRSVLDRYRAAEQAGVSDPRSAYEYEVSEWMEYYHGVGYALEDLDGNGIPELMVAGIDPEYDPGPVLFELYTLENGEPVQLLISWARSRNYLLPDGRIYNEGSGGAASSGFVLFRVNGTALEFLEGWWSSNSADYSGETMYHTTSDEGSPGFGNYDDYDSTMPAREGFALGQQLLETARLPELTPID